MMYDPGRHGGGWFSIGPCPFSAPRHNSSFSATTHPAPRDELFRARLQHFTLRQPSPPPRTPRPPSGGSTHARRAAGDHAHPRARQHMSRRSTSSKGGGTERIGNPHTPATINRCTEFGTSETTATALAGWVSIFTGGETGERRGGREEDFFHTTTRAPLPRVTARRSNGRPPPRVGTFGRASHSMPCKGVMIPVGSGVHAMWHERRRPGGAAAEPHNMRTSSARRPN